MSVRTRPVVHRTSYELARAIAPEAEALLELRRRFEAEEARLTAVLGPDEAPTFADFVAWIVERGTRPPHRPRGQRDRDPNAAARRAAAQRRRRERERAEATATRAAA